MMGVCFLVNLMTSSSDPTCQYFGLQYFFESRPEYAFLEPLIEFPAFLVQKLGQTQLIGKGLNSQYFWGFPKLILRFFWPKSWNKER